MDVIIAMTEMQKAQEDLHKTQKEKIQSIQQMYQNALEAHEEARITNMKYETAFEDAKAAEKHMEYVKDILWTTQLTLKQSQQNLQDLKIRMGILKHELRQDEQTQEKYVADHKKAEERILLLEK